NNQSAAVIVAACKGTRMGTKHSKQYLTLRVKPILIHTLQVFASMEEIKEIIVVSSIDDWDYCEQLIKQYKLDHCTRVVRGGSERQASVSEGLQAVSAEWVLIHDGVRPFVTVQEIRSCMRKAVLHGAAVLGVPVKDTIKQVNESAEIIQTLPRES